MRISDWSADVCSADLSSEELHPTLHLFSGGYSGCELLAENLDDGEGDVEQLHHHSPQGHHRLQSGRTDQALCPMLPSHRLRSRTLLVQTKLSHGVLLCQPPPHAGAPPRLWRVGSKHVKPEHQGGHRAVRWPPAAPLDRTHGAPKQSRFLLQEGFPPRLRAHKPPST